jgi:hypothetical protein
VVGGGDVALSVSPGSAAGIGRQGPQRVEEARFTVSTERADVSAYFCNDWCRTVPADGAGLVRRTGD